ncbi:MAG: hypothetical protein BRD41_04470 [Bacteroidetes bacterium QS_1_63_11]|nr:MAG: hypothetical protein BRD41_04470 [Bacteroidetes bacterium QS_1_63_11]
MQADWQPVELEALLQSHASTVDTAIIPSPDEEAGEAPKALVVEAPGGSVSDTEVKNFVADRMAPQKKIRRVEFVEEVPKTASSKILRRELVEREREEQA